jgi:uncharacterized protein with HEPN domain
MIAFGEKVLAYTAWMDPSAFVTNTLVYDATLRNVELIGEAATDGPARRAAGLSAGALANAQRHARSRYPR